MQVVRLSILQKEKELLVGIGLKLTSIDQPLFTLFFVQSIYQRVYKVAAFTAKLCALRQLVAIAPMPPVGEFASV